MNRRSAIGRIGITLALLALATDDTWARKPGVHPVALAMTVTLDTVGEPDGTSPARHVGEIDHLRLVYDPTAVNPTTRHVKLLNLQHVTGEGHSPVEPDTVAMPMDDAWLDMSVTPYRVHFRAAVTHGSRILIELDEHTRRLTIRAQDRANDIRLAGTYLIDPTPIADQSVSEAVGVELPTRK